MSHRPQVTYNENGDVILTTEVNGLLVRMRMTADEADILGSQIHNMASGARKMNGVRVGRQQKLHEIIGGLAAVDFDATQIRERGIGVHIPTQVPASDESGTGKPATDA